MGIEERQYKRPCECPAVSLKTQMRSAISKSSKVNPYPHSLGALHIHIAYIAHTQTHRETTVD